MEVTDKIEREIAKGVVDSDGDDERGRISWRGGDVAR